MNMPKKILLVEDEPKIAQLLIDYLKASGYRHQWLDNGEDVVEVIKRDAPDLLLLDLMLPGKDGMTICRELRTFSDIPIIILTARVEEIDRLLGLELGADDYICKPFSPREVMARIKALLRRLERTQDDSGTTGFVIDEDKMQIRCNDAVLDLTPHEYRLMVVLLSSPGRVYSRDHLLDQAYSDFRDVSDRSIDSHIKNLRKKIAAVFPNQTVIRSVYGVGYKFEM